MSVLKEFVSSLLGANSNGASCDSTGKGYEDALKEFEAAAPQRGGGGSIPRIESLDTDNMIVLRDLDSGTYVLYGRFVPYAGADSTMNFSSGLLVNLIKRTADTQIQIFYPVNNCIQYLKITDSAYERKDIYLNDLMAAQA